MSHEWEGAFSDDNEDYHFARSCQRKRRYADRSEAMRGRKNMSESNLKAYFCKFCGGWHLGRHGQKDSVFYEKARRGRDRQRKDKNRDK